MTISMSAIDRVKLGETNSRARAFAQFAQCLMIAKGDSLAAHEVFRQRYPRSPHVDIVEKSAITFGTSGDAAWGGPLAPIRQISDGFVELIRPATVLGKLTGVRSAPFNVKIPRVLTGTSVTWVGEGIPVPATAMTLDQLTLTDSKIGGIVAFTNELVRSSDPAATAIISTDLSAGVIAFTDQALLDPTRAAVSGVSPASITYGGYPVMSTGSDTAAIDTDTKAVISHLVDSNIGLKNLHWIMAPSTAIHMAGLRGDGGARSYPDISVLGGELNGIPVITSAAAADNIILVDASELVTADAGIELDASENANLQLVTSPDSPPTAATVYVNLWTMSMLGVRVIRHIRWLMRHANAVAYVAGFTVS